jgi:Fe2+ or Zn2+ uptake regulation protein
VTGYRNRGGTAKASRRALSDTGLRATSQRAVILDIIKQSQDHLDADEIYRRARRREPRISLSTVYRTLQRFKDTGLVEESHFDESHHHYEPKPRGKHHHLVCLKCGQVVEFDFDLQRHIKENVPETAGFDVRQLELRMTGYCADCRE